MHTLEDNIKMVLVESEKVVNGWKWLRIGSVGDLYEHGNVKWNVRSSDRRRVWLYKMSVVWRR
jgi:hypothetical protein